MQLNLTKKLFLGITALTFMVACSSGTTNSTENSEEMENQSPKLELIQNEAEKKIDVLVDGKLFTSFIYPDTLDKPVLFPINTSEGTTITRGWPLAPRPGERFDHPHHIGLWFNYGDVNGLDFWNNSYAIPADKKSNYGHIVLSKINSISSSGSRGQLEVTQEWKNEAGETLLEENTTFIFTADGSDRSIERISILTAINGPVSFTDNKEGMLAIRVARELEHPSTKPELFTDASGKVTDVPTMNNEGITGMYTSSNGNKGDDVWGTRGDWVELAGKIGQEPISVIIYDHPGNVGYPTYWHARGYGLFAANPLGQKAMSEGKEELNYKLEDGQSMTFKFKVDIISGKELSPMEINQLYDSWKTN
ncbi:PmoA family protein [Algoriphagus sp. SE2]|uniref:DUF6807 domain-containing protein n=1 Tax=Algoriphagus sp. SE2 TaxID=3141536 RepID=UPI0031CD4BA0